MERKLSAVLMSDVVGYSRMMAENEAATLSRLNQHRLEVFQPKAAQYRGRTVKLIGDGALMEFASVVDAVMFAVEVQVLMSQRNRRLPDDQKVTFRIGVNLGDVIVEAGDLIGDGVNVASRLEGLAEPGGVCISRSARDQIRDKLDVTLEDLGEVEVKNLPRPVRAFRIPLDEKAIALATPLVVQPSSQANRFPRGALAAIAIAAISLVAGFLLHQTWAPTVEPASVERMAYPLPKKPSIAVLPFVNVGQDPQQEYFADGITSDIITDLSKVSGIFVISRNSTFAYKGHQVDTRTVAEKLGVRYVVEGSVRRAENNVRINAQLIDAVSGGNVWAERYDGNLSDIFTLQDRVTQRVVEALAVKLKPQELAVTKQAGTNSQEAYDAYLRGWAHYRRGTPDEFARAIPFLKRASEIDAYYARPYAALAAIYWTASEERDYLGNPGLFLAELGITYEDAVREREHWLNLLAQTPDDPTPLGFAVQSAQRLRQGEFHEAVALAREAIRHDPNDPIGHESLAKALAYAGRPSEAETAIRAAMRLDPLYKGAYLVWLGLAQFNQDSFAAAAETLSAAIVHNPNNDIALVLMLATAGKLGDTRVATSLLKQMNEFRRSRSGAAVDAGPSGAGIDRLLVAPYTLADADHWPFARLEDRHRLREGLKLAGVPKTAEGLSPLTVVGATTVDAEQAKRLHEEGARFIDTRNQALFNLGHIPGAKLLDFAKDFTEKKLSEKLEHDAPLVIYCEGPKCLRSSKACQKAVAWGYQKVFYFREGFPAWKAAGYQIGRN